MSTDARLDARGRRLIRYDCKTCGHKLDAATCVEGNFRPKAGDVTICINCGEILMFDAEVKTVECDLNAMMDLSEWQRRALGTMQRFIRARGRLP